MAQIVDISSGSVPNGNGKLGENLSKHNQPTTPPLKRAIAIDPTLINTPKKGFSLLKKLSFFKLRKSKSSAVSNEIILENERSEANVIISTPPVTLEDSSYLGTYPPQSQDTSTLNNLQHKPSPDDYRQESFYQTASRIRRSNYYRERAKEHIIAQYDSYTSPTSSTTTDLWLIPRQELPFPSPSISNIPDSLSTTMSFVSLDANSIATVNSPISEVLDLYGDDVEAAASKDPQPASKGSLPPLSRGLSTKASTRGLDSSIQPTRVPSLPSTDATLSEKDPQGDILVKRRPATGNISPQTKVSFDFGKGSHTSPKFRFAHSSKSHDEEPLESPTVAVHGDLQFLRDRKRRMEEQDRLLAEELQRLIIDEGGYAETSKPHRRRHSDFKTLHSLARRGRLQRIAAEDAILAAEIYRCEQEDFAIEQRQREQKEKAEKERVLAIERQKQEEQARLFAEETRLTAQFGVPIGVRQASLDGLIQGSLAELTPDISERLQKVKLIFSMSIPAIAIRKVEWIVNERLQAEFEESREQLRSCGRPTNELLLFHGTYSQNIVPILTQGFRVGGVGGHFVTHGQSMGVGIYSSTEASMPVHSYSKGSRMCIGFRALPGCVSYSPLFHSPGPVGSEPYDSHVSGLVYVIRRPSQTLPCFLIHY